MMKIFKKIPKMIKEAERTLGDFDFSSFVVGCVLPRKVEAEEESCWEKKGISRASANTKHKINKLIGARLEKKFKTRASHAEPDVSLLFDFQKEKVAIHASPLFVYGRYTKISREMPQNPMPNYYESSIEDIVGKVLCAYARGEEFKIHGCGREDIDARMLGDGRPFILEISEPKIRKIDLARAEREISSSADGKVGVSGLRFARAFEVRMVKNARPEKTYFARVITEKEIDNRDIACIEKLEGAAVLQRTPTRVAHRRADKVRKREIKRIYARKKGARELELEITTSAGTYVKELISGDNGRTRPSISEILGCAARCAELDVIKIKHEFLSDYW